MLKTRTSIGFTLLLLSAVLLSACGETARSTPVPSLALREFEKVECKGSTTTQAGFKVDCGYLTVPENRSQPDGRQIRLYVAILRTRNKTPQPDPLFYLEGGPGGRAHEMIFPLSTMLAKILAERDIVILDQRGTGWSEPVLDCPEPNQKSLEAIAAGLSNDEAFSQEQDGWLSCRERLIAEGIDLSMYNSAASADDVADLTKTLGYEKYNLLGVSYGTRLALTILRDNPKGVRSVILDSVIPPNVDFFETITTNAQRSLDLVFERCAADPKCGPKYPNLETDFYTLVDQLNKDPITVQAAGINYPVHGDDLINVVFNTLYDYETIRQLPELIANTSQGSTEWLGMWLDYIYSMSVDWGAHLSSWCSEEIPYNSKNETAQQDAKLKPAIVAGMELDGDYYQSCKLWNVTPAGNEESDAVSSTVPVLMLAGDYDPVTPPEFARLAAETLENSRLYEFESRTHGVMFSTICARDMMYQFITAPESELDTSCMDQLKISFNIY
jgi:pimeloyl-ACP methyl ester carboxylesterase